MELSNQQQDPPISRQVEGKSNDQTIKGGLDCSSINIHHRLGLNSGKIRGGAIAAILIANAWSPALGNPTPWQQPQFTHLADPPQARRREWREQERSTPSESTPAAQELNWQPIQSAGDNSSSRSKINWTALTQEQSKEIEELHAGLGSPQTGTKQLASEADIRRSAFRNQKKQPFRSASRSIVYGETLYPEMGFWIPSAFRQSTAYRFTLTGQLLGNPTNTTTPDWCNWTDFWNKCSDAQYLAEVTPAILGPLSVGVNFSQQESFTGSRSDGSFQQGGQAVGFQAKVSPTENVGLGVIGSNLWNPNGGGGPNGSYPSPGEEIQADLGRAYLWLASSAIDLGFWLGSTTPAILAITAGAGNGRYKSADDIKTQWINYGSYGPIGALGLAFNSRFSVFAEYAGQYMGIGLSVKPLSDVPVTATLMFRDFQGVRQGITNCVQGLPSNCRTTIDGRITISF